MQGQILKKLGRRWKAKQSQARNWNEGRQKGKGNWECSWLRNWAKHRKFDVGKTRTDKTILPPTYCTAFIMQMSVLQDLWPDVRLWLIILYLRKHLREKKKPLWAGCLLTCKIFCCGKCWNMTQCLKSGEAVGHVGSVGRTVLANIIVILLRCTLLVLILFDEICNLSDYFGANSV